MEAFADVMKTGFDNYKLKFFGDGPDRLKLQRLSVSLGIDRNVEFVGSVEHVAEHIEKATMFILFSDQEGMPNSLIEAMSLGLPCISSDCPCGGPKDLIVDGENGILVPVRDKDALKKAMLQLLKDPSYADKLGANATKVQEKFSPQKVNRMWEEYLLSKR